AHSIGTVKRTRPRYMVNSQLKIFTPVGMAIIIVVNEKNELTSAPEPIVKKWCSHTRYDRIMIAMVAYTSDEYANSGLPENVGTIRMYTSGWPQIQIRLMYIIRLPPNPSVKKWVPT